MRDWCRLAGILLMLSFVPQTLIAQAAAGANGVAGSTSTLQQELARLEALVQSLRKEIAQANAAKEAPGDQDRQASLEARLAAVEKALEELRGEIAAVNEATQGISDSLDALSYVEERRTNLTVYGTFVASKFDDDDTVFDAEAVELVLSARPHDKLALFAEIEFERATAVGGGRGGEVEIEQAHVSYEFVPAFGLRAGVMLVPFGHYNIEHFAPARDIISPPLAATVVVPTDWADNGLGFYGRGALGGGWALSYETYLISGLDADIGLAGTRGGRQSFGRDNNNDKAAVGRIAVQHLDDFELGLSGYSGKYDAADRLAATGFAVDHSSAVGPVRLTGDYYDLSIEQPLGPETSLKGYFARIAFDFGRKLLQKGWHGRYFPEAKFTLMFQQEEVEIEGLLAGTVVNLQEERQTYGFAYRPSHQWVLKINHEQSRAETAPVVNGTTDGWLLSIAFVF